MLIQCEPLPTASGLVKAAGAKHTGNRSLLPHLAPSSSTLDSHGEPPLAYFFQGSLMGRAGRL